jgi:hypothetical protein
VYGRYASVCLASQVPRHDLSHRRRPRPRSTPPMVDSSEEFVKDSHRQHAANATEWTSTACLFPLTCTRMLCRMTQFLGFLVREHLEVMGVGIQEGWGDCTAPSWLGWDNKQSRPGHRLMVSLADDPCAGRSQGKRRSSVCIHERTASTALATTSAGCLALANAIPGRVIETSSTAPTIFAYSHKFTCVLGERCGTWQLCLVSSCAVSQSGVTKTALWLFFAGQRGYSGA